MTSEQQGAIEGSVPKRNSTKALIHALHSTPVQDKNGMLKDFFIWAEPRWAPFMNSFRPDSTMQLPDFQKFMKDGGGNGKQYQLGKFTGDAVCVFQSLCEDGCDYITRFHCMQGRRAALRRTDICAVGASGFRKVFASRFGNLSTAWRLVLDPDNSGRCSKVTFLKQVKAYGYHGTLKTCWAELTGGDQHRTIRMVDLDPEASDLMAEFAQALVSRYGDLKDGWTEVMTHAHGKRLDLPCFTDLINDLGMHRRDARKLFHCFDPRDFGTIHASLSEDNCSFLKNWDPAGAGDGSPVSTGFSSSPGQSSPEKFGVADDGAVIGIDAPALTFEFQVVLSKEEYNEYLRRRRVLRGQVAESHGVKQSAKSPMFHLPASPSASTRSIPPSPGASPGQTSFAGATTPRSMTPRGGPASPRATTPRVELNSAMTSPRQTPQTMSPQRTPRGGFRQDLPERQQTTSLNQHFQLTIPEGRRA